MDCSERSVIINGDSSSSVEILEGDSIKIREDVNDEADASTFENIVKRAKNSKLLSSSKDRDKEAASASGQQIVWGSKDAAEYDMRHRRRGVALVFNHATFKKGTPRRGTEKDCQDLDTQLSALGFEVKVHNDLEYKKLREVLEKTSKEDHSDADCLVVIVMTHGEPGQISARDHPYREEELWKRFTGDRCVSLLGKPKLFFIQACRGDLVDNGMKVSATVTDSSPMATYMIPTQADILLSYATVDGYRSWRAPMTGSWYIQALCEELSLHGRIHDLLTILTFVHRRVAVDCMSNIIDVPELHMKLQMPAFTSMLTRLVFFRDKVKKKTKKSSSRTCASPDEGMDDDDGQEVEGDDMQDEIFESVDEERGSIEKVVDSMRTGSTQQSKDLQTSYSNQLKEEQAPNREVVTRETVV